MLAVISGSAQLPVDMQTEVLIADRPFGEPSGAVWQARLDGTPILTLARHGEGVRIAPHAINYRANLHALAAVGARWIIAIHTVGGIRPDLQPGDLLVPDQLIDYTHGRISTFAPDTMVRHIEFSEPFSSMLADRLIDAAAATGLAVHQSGVYACTQGPRLETAAEIDRLERDGCCVVGMTAMPEAALARELGLAYVSLCLVVNPAAGRGAIEASAIARAAVAGGDSIAQLVAACAKVLESQQH